MDGKTANNHAIRIVDAKASADLRSCQVLYVATDNNNEIRQTLASPELRARLTIGEGDRFWTMAVRSSC